MASITIKLRYNKRTGKKDIVIEYESDEDQTGWEHEKEHKRIVEELIGKGILEEGEFGEVIRERAGAATPGQSEEAPAPPEKNLEGQGQ